MPGTRSSFPCWLRAIGVSRMEATQRSETLELCSRNGSSTPVLAIFCTATVTLGR